MLEQLAVSERHRAWVDQVAQLFGGLDICAIELLVGKDGREYIIEVNDSALSLMGDSQEEDRRHIADLVTAKMQVEKKEKETCVLLSLSFSLRTDSNKFGYLSLNYPSSPPPFFFSFFLNRRFVPLPSRPVLLLMFLWNIFRHFAGRRAFWRKQHREDRCPARAKRRVRSRIARYHQQLPWDRTGAWDRWLA